MPRVRQEARKSEPSVVMYGTEERGDTWRPMLARGPDPITFADLTVGSSMFYREMMYTTNGGHNWTTRAIPFPEMVNAFSIPRRDRGYAVGDHG